MVAFGGRSNVGKSSLLNRLLGEPVARVSGTPGRTRAIYFFDSERGWMAADLPGFGYARAARLQRAEWARLTEQFFETGVPSLTVALVDPRISTSDYDRAFRDYLRELKQPTLFVATKADRLGPKERIEAGRRLERDFGPVHFVSSRTGEGVEKLRNMIEQHLAAGKRESRTYDGQTI